MPAPGGQAAIAGFLFQIVGTLFRAVEVTAEVRSERVRFDGDELSDATLILEPRGGGDLQVVDQFGRIVEQFKRRGTGRSWTDEEVLQHVLPDLYRDVSARGTIFGTRYRFTTDGRIAAKNLQAIVEIIRGRSPPNDCLSELDDVEQRFRIGQGRVTARRYFHHIAVSLDPASHDPRGVWTLLANLQLIASISGSMYEQQIDALLADAIDYQERAGATRHELIGRLFSLAQNGTAIGVRDLFQAVGVNVDRLALVASLPLRLTRVLRAEATAVGYEPAADVRSEAPALSNTPIQLLRGESGQGKTWMQMRLALQLANAGKCVVWVSSGSDLEEIERLIVERTWHSSGFGAPTPIAVVANRLKPKFDEAGYWLTLMVDDVSDRKLAGKLISPRWQEMGIRVVLSCQPDIAEAVIQQALRRTEKRKRQLVDAAKFC